MKHQYYKIYKPYNVLSQFTPEIEGQKTLADLYTFPTDVYPVGRLDYDSEGLLMLTNDKKWNQKLLNPKNQHERCYLVQVEGLATEKQINELKKGVEIKLKDKTYKTLPIRCELLNEAPRLPERNPPIRYRASIPTSWLKMHLIEGKNRQVRKMTAKVGLATLRLVRYSILHHNIESMKVGEVIELSSF